MLVNALELKWLKDKVMPYLNLDRIDVTEDQEHTSTYPDIWAEGTTITVTREWARQRPRERRKRLLHEALHLWGLGHQPSIGYNSHPEKDTFSYQVLDAMENGVPIEKIQDRGHKTTRKF